VMYQNAMQGLVSEQLRTHLETEARKERTRFRKAFSAFGRTAEYFTSYQPLQRQLQRWNRHRSNETVPAISRWKPDWLAATRTVDGSIPIDFALVLGAQRDVYAIYKVGQLDLPGELASAVEGLLLSVMQRYGVRIFDTTAYLVSAWPVDGVQGMLLIASRIDQKFMNRMLDASSGVTVSVLLLGTAQQTVASSFYEVDRSHLQLVSKELLVDTHAGAEIRHAVWVDKRRIDDIGEQILFSVRQQRTVFALVFAVLFSIAVAWISCRIKKIHRTVESYSRRLGIHPPKLSMATR